MPKRKQSARLLLTLSLAGVLGAATVGLVLAHPETAPTRPAAPPALPVETRPLVLQDGYMMQRSFSGTVQARRASVLGFDQGGRLARVLVDEGVTVSAGQLLAELDTKRLAAQRAERVAATAEAEANLALANLTLRRLRGVVDKGSVSRQGLDEAREAQRAAQAGLVLAKRRVASIDTELEKARLTAPFDGIVVARSADEGRVLDAGQPVLTLQERATPEIRIGVAGRVLDRLETGAVYGLTWRETSISARLRALLPLRAVTTRTVDALFDPLDPPPGLLTGDILTLTLEHRITQRGGWLPLSALTEGERGLWSLYSVESLDNTANDLAATHRVIRRTVDVVHQGTDRVFVKGALSPEQRVVTAGLLRLVPGQLVRLAGEPVTLADARDD